MDLIVTYSDGTVSKYLEQNSGIYLTEITSFNIQFIVEPYLKINGNYYPYGNDTKLVCTITLSISFSSIGALSQIFNALKSTMTAKRAVLTVPIGDESLQIVGAYIKDSFTVFSPNADSVETEDKSKQRTASFTFSGELII